MKEDNDLTKAKELLTQYMTINSMRKTAERYAILEVVYNSGQHLSADDIYIFLADKFRVSRATVYNTLEMLFRANLILRHQFENAVVYEKRSNTPHYHMKCLECGTITEFQNVTLKNVLSTVKLKEFHISDHDLYVYGTCARCRRIIGRLKKQLLKNNDKKTL